MSHNGQRTPVQYTLLIQRIDGTNVVVGKGVGATLGMATGLKPAGAEITNLYP
jgi:hypothetical protein